MSVPFVGLLKAGGDEDTGGDADGTEYDLVPDYLPHHHTKASARKHAIKIVIP